jgi:outer membrane protein assembly factor BamB
VAASVGSDLQEYRSILIGEGELAVAATTGSGSDGTQDERATGAAGGSEEAIDDPDALNTAIGTLVAETAAPSGFRPDPSLWVDPVSSGRPWSDLGAAEGLLTFRGNPTRSFYGRGPLPDNPSILWTFNIGCSSSPVGGEPKTWCGSGWTGQPSVFRSPTTGSWWVAFGAYNRAVNFLDPEDGSEAFPPYFTNDIIKGSVTVDPDGFPLLYTGSRDNDFHVVALDRDTPTPLWTLPSDAVQPTMWNNDWDGSALVINDHLFIGGENGRFFVVELNREFGPDGKVTVEPEITFSTESWDQELLNAVGDQQVSVENSVAVSGNVVYFTNSAGLVQGWDVGGLTQGVEPTRVFRYWTGDDTDASIVVDDEGMLYLGSEYERGTQRSRELGQIIKLDPSRPDDPVVWSREANEGLDSGVWATPAIHGDLVIVATDGGDVYGLDRADGRERWHLELPGPLWSSPVVVDDTLVQADCDGNLNAFDLAAEPGAGPPPVLWTVALGGCLESTPAVWDGQIYVGSRSGTFYAVGDPDPGASRS